MPGGSASKPVTQTMLLSPPGPGMICCNNRLLVATGKIVHELRAERKKRGDARTAIMALEQHYLFPEKELAAAFNQHPAAREAV